MTKFIHITVESFFIHSNICYTFHLYHLLYLILSISNLSWVFSVVIPWSSTPFPGASSLISSGNKTILNSLPATSSVIGIGESGGSAN